MLIFCYRYDGFIILKYDGFLILKLIKVNISLFIDIMEFFKLNN